MKKFTFLVLFLLTGFAYIFAQSFTLTDKLPNDPKVISGTLDNGMKYYIRSNSTPANRAELGLVVNAGSILEDDDQQGLAHFVEHMAFNGTKNFPEHELVNYLESLGMKFGPEVNAYTGFDVTFYGIKVPTDSMEYLDKGLLVLYDWASQLTLDTDEIEAERGVIHEEWRMSQGGMDRVQNKYMKAIFHNSRYAERLPIGTMEVVDNFDPEVLRRFYYDWYRPDLMAVIAVGDFNSSEIEQKIKGMFGKIEKHPDPKERFYADVPSHKETLVSVATDPEVPMSMVQIFYKHPRKQQITVADYREDLVASFMSSMISNRLRELTMLENPPFIQAFSGYSEYTGPLNVYASLGIVQNNDVKRTLEALVAENQRMLQHGFTESEFEREKASFTKTLEKYYNERDKQSSESYMEEYRNNYLFPYTPYPGVEYEYELFNYLIPGITLEDINEFAKKMVTGENTVIVVVAPEKEGVVVPSEDEILKIYNNVMSQKVEAYVDNVSEEPLISEMPSKGKVAKISKNKDFDYEVWTLKNGIKVVLKTTDFKKDEVLFYANSKGGYSLYDQKDNINARIAAGAARESGLAGFDRMELQKYLADKNARVSPYISELYEGIEGGSSVNDFETLLQLIHVSFSKPKVTESAFNSYVNKQKGALENQGQDPQSIWQDTVRWIMSGYDPLKQPMTAELLNNADFKRTRTIYGQRFNDPVNFTFYFVGNIDKKKAKPLIEQYLGSLNSVERNETFVDNGSRPPKGKVEKIIKKAKDQKCLEMIVFHGEFEYNKQNMLEIDAICKVLSNKLLEEIREKESGVYAIDAYPSFSKYPYSNYKISIAFSCDPDREDELFNKILGIIKNVQKDAVTSVNIQKVVEQNKRELETSVKENGYWLGTLMDIEGGFLSGDDYKNYPKMINGITVESITKAADKYINLNNYIKVVLFPEG